MLRAASVALAAALALAGCSGGHKKEAQQPRAQPLSAQNPVSAAMPPSSPAEYRRPIRIYRRHVLRLDRRGRRLLGGAGRQHARGQGQGREQGDGRAGRGMSKKRSHEASDVAGWRAGMLPQPR